MNNIVRLYGYALQNGIKSIYFKLIVWSIFFITNFESSTSLFNVKRITYSNIILVY